MVHAGKVRQHHAALRWWAGSFYIYNAKGELPTGIEKNTSHGVTISIKKHGGHGPAWELAQKCANWK